MPFRLCSWVPFIFGRRTRGDEFSLCALFVLSSCCGIWTPSFKCGGQFFYMFLSHSMGGDRFALLDSPICGEISSALKVIHIASHSVKHDALLFRFLRSFFPRYAAYCVRACWRHEQEARHPVRKSVLYLFSACLIFFPAILFSCATAVPMSDADLGKVRRVAIWIVPLPTQSDPQRLLLFSCKRILCIHAMRSGTHLTHTELRR